MEQPPIVLKKVRVHNLKNIDLTLPSGELIVLTGVSGSGKSSLAFDTIYSEGQRRYIESLSTFARRHLGDFPKPDAELISGISPTIAIEQKTSGKNPRSSVGTMTGIYDFLRVLYARAATPHCPISGEPIAPQSAEHILRKIQTFHGAKILVLAPYAKQKKGEFKEDFEGLLRKGFTRVRLDGAVVEISDDLHLDKQKAHDIDLIVDRLELTEANRPRLAEAVKQALELGQGLLSIVDSQTNEETLFSQHAYAVKSGISYPPLEPQDFSFNHPSGMCPTCQGLGIIQEFDLGAVIDPDKSIAEDCCKVAGSYETVRWGNTYDNLARLYRFSVTTPWKKLAEEAKQVFLYGNDRKWTKMEFRHPTKKSRWTEYVQWRGVLFEARKRLQEATSEFYRAKMREWMHESVCPDCRGQRIKPYPAAAEICGKRIADVTAMPISDALEFFCKLELTGETALIASELVKECIRRLRFLNDVGLHYLSLERTSPTLSGGEAQRVRLASQIGAGLVGTTYVLDEPSIGLHARDNRQLIATLKLLRDLGNTVIVVEHDEETIAAAEMIVDIGPGAGAEGGEIVVQGTLADLMKSKRSLTGGYLSRRLSIPVPEERRFSSTQLIIEGAGHHNLCNIDVSFPLGLFIAVTGVSGSGKSSLISDTLYPALANYLHNAKLTVGKHRKIRGLEHLDKVIAVDQSPIGRTPRSNPATYVKLFDDIRELFSDLPEAQAFGFTSSRFSFNLKEGSCPHCSGMGMLRIDMDFLEDEWVPCTHCKGQRFDEKTLSILYKGKNIYDILEMPVDDAATFFSAIPTISRKLTMLQEVGLGYMKIGQPSPTLSGGEAQRIKLARELVRPPTGRTLYIFDEPTTGLHFHDIARLIRVLGALSEKGNTIIVIEHNTDLIKTADWVIDLGPEGGRGGGRLVGTGTPEAIAKQATPTGEALHRALHPAKYPLHKARATKKRAPITTITVVGAEQNNLKGVDAELPRGGITVCTGPSGSGKSSFAFETLYAEGQRRYVESMSLYARQFVKQCPKPKVEKIEGLSPAIAIEQKSHAGNPRSTVGTITEVYDYLRILYAHCGVAHCPDTGEKLETISHSFVAEQLLALPEKTPLYILTSMTMRKAENFTIAKEQWKSQGFLRLRVNGTYYELDEEIPFDSQRKNAVYLVIDRLFVAKSRKRLLEAIEQAERLAEGHGQGQILVDAGGKDLFYNFAFAAPSTGKSYPPLTPHTFSFNTAQGMCPECTGLGTKWGVDLSANPQWIKLTPLQLLALFWEDHRTPGLKKTAASLLDEAGVDPYTQVKDLLPDALHTFLDGSAETNSGLIWRGLNLALGIGIKTLNKEEQEHLKPWLKETPCAACQGTRLTPLARYVVLDGKTLPELCALPIDELYTFIRNLSLPSKERELLEEPLRQLSSRLEFLREIGVGYLSIDRRAPTLSGGEAQRIRLARQLGSGLTGCLYVLDEPTVGLHPYNNALLNAALQHLKQLGNTLVLVEHDPMTVGIADLILDFGPHAGKQGGKIVARGTLPEILANPHSLTGAYLSGRKKIQIPEKRREIKKWITIENASVHNLQHLSLRVPVQALSCVTGVSGSGKSTLIHDLLQPAASQAVNSRTDSVQLGTAKISGLGSFEKVIILEQNPIGKTNRADVGTYVDILTPLRSFFASLPIAQARGLQPKHFSFNHKQGMCTHCQGLGTRTVSLQFLPPVHVPCESCRGNRLNPVSLLIEYKGKHLGHVFHMSIEEACGFLPPIPKVQRLLATLMEVGLGYLQVGQEIATLSGGEAQRLRLARELAKSSKGKILYLLDEPTIGLHSDDIAKLLPIFRHLVEQGHTLIVIEHNLDLIAQADYLIDLGPDAGAQGGLLMASGTPEQVASSPSSRTAPYLREHLQFLRSTSITKKKRK